MLANRELQDDIQILASYLEQPRSVLIVTHINPDGDAMGSSMGLYHYLLKLGHTVSVLIPNDFPDFLAWMKESDKAIIFNNNQTKAKTAIANCEIIICVDFNDFRRLKDLGPLLDASPAIKALIDHHPDPDNVYTYKIHTIEAAASAELIYKLIVGSGNRALLDSDIAQYIYTGIMTDTGCFNHNSSNPETFTIVADLLSTGFDKDLTHSNVYDNYSVSRMKLMGYCLNNKMVVLPHLHTAYISLTKEEMDRYNFRTGDAEGFVNLPFSIKGIFITALITEKKDHVRISMRSRGSFAINEICEKYFEGGGHKNAAGGETKLSITETIDKFEKLLELYSDAIQKNKWPQ